MQQAIAPGTVIDKRYQIQKKTPDNTSNRCYLAEDTDQSNRLVVISFPRMELLSLPGFTTAFEDACQRLMKARLNGLVKILDYGEYESQPYSVLQYVTHETLASSLDARKNNQKKLSVEEVLDWARPLAVTLDELHELDYVHSNVRPEMIYLGQKRQILLGDFVTEFTVQRLGAFKQAISSLDIADHLAPEYIKSNYNESYDQYLLASIIYNALAGRSHFHNPGSTEAYRRQVATKFPESLLTHRPELVGASRVLGKALERNPVKRFDSCREFVNQLGSAKVNPVFDNNDDRPVTVIKKVIDETAPVDPIITSIRPNRSEGRKKGFIWLGVLLLGIGAGAYAVNQFGGFEQLKTKISMVLSDKSRGMDANTKTPQVIVPISGNLASAPATGNSAEISAKPIQNTSNEQQNTSNEQVKNPAQSIVDQQAEPTVVSPDNVASHSVVTVTSGSVSIVDSQSATDTAERVATGKSDASSEPEAKQVGEPVTPILSESGGDEPIVIAEEASSNTVSVINLSNVVIDDAALQAAIDVSLNEAEAEFIKNRDATDQLAKVIVPDADINDAITLALREAEFDFLRKTSPASSEQDGASNSNGDDPMIETVTSGTEVTEQKTDEVVDNVVNRSPEVGDQSENTTEQNNPLSPEEIEAQDLNAQMFEADRLADEQAAAARLAAEEKKKQQELRREARKQAREEAKRNAELAAAQKKAEDNARRGAADAAKLQQQRGQASAAEATNRQNNEELADEVVSTAATKSLEEMQKERARLQALKAQKIARISSITKDCVTSGKIHRQVIAGNLPYVKNCLSVGVDPNLTQSNRWTLLHLASLGGYLNMAKLLVAKGATVNAKAADGKTPLDMATEQKQERLVTYLRSRGGVTTR